MLLRKFRWFVLADPLFLKGLADTRSAISSECVGSATTLRGNQGYVFKGDSRFRCYVVRRQPGVAVIARSGPLMQRRLPSKDDMCSTAESNHSPRKTSYMYYSYSFAFLYNNITTGWLSH